MFVHIVVKSNHYQPVILDHALLVILLVIGYNTAQSVLDFTASFKTGSDVLYSHGDRQRPYS